MTALFAGLTSGFAAESLSDKVWTWGYMLDRTPSACPFVDGKTSWSIENEIEYLGAKKQTFYMNSIFNSKYARKYFPAWDEECFANCINSKLSDAHFRKLAAVRDIWCGVEHGNYLASAIKIAELSLEHKNIKGLNFDDFNNGQPETAMSPAELRELREAIHKINPELKIAIVTYTHLSNVTPYRDYVDVVSYWCWKARHDYWDNYAAEIAKLRRQIGPNKTILQGIYIRDYGTSDMKSPRAMPIDLFKKSILTVRAALIDGTIDGVIIPQAGWFGAPEHREHIVFIKENLR